MRKLCFIFLPSFFSLFISAQVNLVPNPSFETYTACPSAPAEIPKALGWTHNGSSDYYNFCGPTNQTSVPYNWGGFQQAASGDAYAGIITYYSLSSNYREYLSTSLISPLSIGVKYFVSFKLNLSLGSAVENANCATDKTGVMFSTIQHTGFYQIITNGAKVYTNSIVTDTLVWTKVFGSFVSDSAYNYIILGNFFDDTNTNKTIVYNTSYNHSYYYIDDVCVSTDSLYALNYVYTGVRENNVVQHLLIYPNPSVGLFFIENASGNYSYEVTNILGEILLNEENISEKNHVLNLSFYEDNLYFLCIKTKLGTSNYKLFKQ